MIITIHNLETALKQILESPVNLTPQTNVRQFIRDSIDLGEVLAVLDLEINLVNFKEVITVSDFLAVVNQKI